MVSEGIRGSCCAVCRPGGSETLGESLSTALLSARGGPGRRPAGRTSMLQAARQADRQADGRTSLAGAH